MDDFLNTLSSYVHQILTDCEIAAENDRASTAMGEDILADMERRGHIEFSMFAPNGRV